MPYRCLCVMRFYADYYQIRFFNIIGFSCNIYLDFVAAAYAVYLYPVYIFEGDLTLDSGEKGKATVYLPAIKEEYLKN